MGFIERAFTPPGSGAAPPQAPAPPPAPAEAAPPPAPPTMPTIAPPAPPVFSAGQAPGQRQRSQITGTSLLGAAATGGELARSGATGRGSRTLLGQ